MSGYNRYRVRGGTPHLIDNGCGCRIYSYVPRQKELRIRTRVPVPGGQDARCKARDRDETAAAQRIRIRTYTATRSGGTARACPFRTLANSSPAWSTSRCRPWGCNCVCTCWGRTLTPDLAQLRIRLQCICIWAIARRDILAMEVDESAESVRARRSMAATRYHTAL